MLGNFDVNGFNANSIAYGPGFVPGITNAGMNASASNVVSGSAGTNTLFGSGGAGIPGIQAPSLGFNIPTFQLALGGIQTIGNLWAAFEANKLAKQQFAYTKNVTDTNLANQIKAYNTTLEDKITSRAAFEGGHNGGMTRDQVGGYLDEHKLSRQAA